MVKDTLPLASVGLVALAMTSRVAQVLLVAGVVGAALGWVGMRWRATRGPVPRVLAFAGFALASALAGVLAWRDALAGRRRPIWDPTRRPT
jgi:hypothetical protein